MRVFVYGWQVVVVAPQAFDIPCSLAVENRPRMMCVILLRVLLLLSVVLLRSFDIGEGVELIER